MTPTRIRRDGGRQVNPRPMRDAPQPFADPRLTRVRRLAWLLDRSIPLGRNLRIGLDPLIGLLPAGGDAIGVAIALYIVWEGARLGLPARVVARMLGNVALEGIIGTVPLVGDLFDAAWQANVRNVKLIEAHVRPDQANRPIGRIAIAFIVVAVLLLAGVVAIAVWMVTALWQWLS